jgi:hypothetical protein
MTLHLEIIHEERWLALTADRYLEHEVPDHSIGQGIDVLNEMMDDQSVVDKIVNECISDACLYLVDNMFSEVFVSQEFKNIFDQVLVNDDDLFCKHNIQSAFEWMAHDKSQEQSHDVSGPGNMRSVCIELMSDETIVSDLKNKVSTLYHTSDDDEEFNQCDVPCGYLEIDLEEDDY